MEGAGLAFARRSQPKRAKWKMDANRAGVMLVDSGIQLNRCARHSRAREQSCSLSWSSMGMGWHSSLEYWLLCSRLHNTSATTQQDGAGGD